MAEEPEGGAWTGGGWDGHAAARRRALAGLTPDQRMEWLEGMLTLLADSGALARDRAHRQDLAERWGASAPRS